MTDIRKGEVLEVEYTAANVGDSDATQDITLSVDGTQQDADSGVAVASGDRATGTLTWDTSTATTGSKTVTVASSDDSDDTTIEIVVVADFAVSITSTNSPVTEGDTLEVDYDVTNNGSETDGQTLELVVNGNVQSTQFLEVDAGETVSDTLTWATSSGDAGDYTAEVSSDDDSDTASVTVEDPTPTNGTSTIWSKSYSGNNSIDMNADYVAHTDSGVRLLNRSDGSSIYQKNPISGARSMAVNSNGTFFSDNDGSAARVNTTGSTEWTKNIAGSGNSVNTVALDGAGAAYFGDNNGDLTKLSQGDGSQDFQRSLYGQLVSMALDSGDIFVARGNDNKITRYSVSNDNNIWSYSVSDQTNNLAIDSNNVYASYGPFTDESTVVAIDRSTGNQVWETAVSGGTGDINSLAAGQGAVYVAHDDNNIYGLDADDGTQLWSENRGETMRSTAYDDGDLVTGGGNGTVELGDLV